MVQYGIVIHGNYAVQKSTPWQDYAWTFSLQQWKQKKYQFSYPQNFLIDVKKPTQIYAQMCDYYLCILGREFYPQGTLSFNPELYVHSVLALHI